MKIEVGKFYRTRAGHKARVYATDAGGSYPIHGAIGMDGAWTTADWCASGHFVADSEEAASDLIGQWREPVKVNGWVNVFADGGCSLIFESKQRADEFATTRVACVFVSGQEEV